MERPHVAKMLEEIKPTLDEMFGGGSYGIQMDGEYTATLRTRVADFQFTDDPRDFVLAYVVAVPGHEVIQSPTEIWMRFLGEETPIQKRTDPYQKQLANELQWIATIVDRILKDRDKTREAVGFIKGYNAAYNDWASGKGSWTYAIPR